MVSPGNNRASSGAPATRSIHVDRSRARDAGCFPVKTRAAARSDPYYIGNVWLTGRLFFFSGLDSYAGIDSRMPAGQKVGLFWNRGHCVGHWPRHRLRTALSTIQMAVILRDTSNPTSSMNLRRRESSGDTARIAALSANQAPTAIIGCLHLTILGRSYGN